MTIYVGGRRRRLIKDNFYNLINDSLDALDWFDPSRKHKPVSVVNSQIDNSDEIKPNVVGISTEDLVSEDMELGSNLESNIWSVFVDVFAESENLGLHLAGDIYDIVRGKLPSIGRTDSSFEVLDLSAATPSSLFVCEFESIELGRNRDWAKPYNKFWWTVALEIVDFYSDEDDS